MTTPCASIGCDGMGVSCECHPGIREAVSGTKLRHARNSWPWVPALRASRSGRDDNYCPAQETP
jgi:hypothetical protein